MSDRLADFGRSMLLNRMKDSIEEIIEHFEKDVKDTGDGGFVGDVMEYYWEHGFMVLTFAMQTLKQKLLKHYGHLDYWFANVVKRIEGNSDFLLLSIEEKEIWNIFINSSS